MSEITKCPTCGSDVRIVSSPYMAGEQYVIHHEPLGLDALERSVLAAAEVVIQGHGKTHDVGYVVSHRDYYRLRGLVQDLLAARATHVGKEAGEVTDG